jgi:pyruvate,water dikinase
MYYVYLLKLKDKSFYTWSTPGAIVTDQGGSTSHAVIVSRELAIPCVVGTSEATKKLKDGDVITVDGEAGLV